MEASSTTPNSSLCDPTSAVAQLSSQSWGIILSLHLNMRPNLSSVLVLTSYWGTFQGSPLASSKTTVQSLLSASLTDLRNILPQHREKEAFTVPNGGEMEERVDSWSSDAFWRDWGAFMLGLMMIHPAFNLVQVHACSVSDTVQACSRTITRSYMHPYRVCQWNTYTL